MIYLGAYRWHHPDLHIRLRRTKPATIEALDRKAVVEHLRLDPGAENGPEAGLLDRLIAAATAHFERYCSCAVIEQEWTMTLRGFPPYRHGLTLPYPPLVDVTSFAVEGDAQDLTEYVLELDDRLPSAVFPKLGQWPQMPDMGTAEIVFTCGRASIDELPDDMRQALLMAIASWYENRESVTQFALTPMVELGWESLCSHYREVGFA